MSSPAVCHRCGEKGTACCTSPFGVSLAPLLPGEVDRLVRRTGLAREAFTAERAIDHVEQQALWADDPVLDGLGRDGSLVSLKIVDGACVFLGTDGCTLGEDRPLLCRRFPFVRTAPRRLEVRPGGDCLACEEAPDLPSLLVTLGTDRAQLRQLDRSIRRAMDPTSGAPAAARRGHGKAP